MSIWVLFESHHINKLFLYDLPLSLSNMFIKSMFYLLIV